MAKCRDNRKRRLKRSKREQARYLARLAATVSLRGNSPDYYKAKVTLSSSGKGFRSRIVAKPSRDKLYADLAKMCGNATVSLSEIYPELKPFQDAMAR